MLKLERRDGVVTLTIERARIGHPEMSSLYEHDITPEEARWLLDTLPLYVDASE